MTSSAKPEVRSLTYYNATPPEEDRATGRKQHAQKTWLSFDIRFLRYDCAETDTQTDTVSDAVCQLVYFATSLVNKDEYNTRVLVFHVRQQMLVYVAQYWGT